MSEKFAAVMEQNHFKGTSPMHLEIPPSYEDSRQHKSTELSLYSAPSTSSPILDVQPAPSTFKPIVIPQTSKSFRGPFFSPFSRAYSPSLRDVSIDESEFLFFLDGLNEAFVAAPAFQMASNVGTVMSFAPLPSVRFTGMGIALGAGLVSSATSWLRARSYVKTANEEFFLPRGLRCRVLKTKKMMPHVGHGSERLELPPLDNLEWSDECIGGKDDPRMRRVLALGDLVAPLTFEGLPPPEPIENWWKKWGHKSAQKQDAKMQKKLLKKRMKFFEEYQEKMEDAEKEARKGDQEIAKIEREKSKELAKAERKLSQKGDNPRKRAKIEEDLSDELGKLDKDFSKAVREKEKKVGKKIGKSDKHIKKVDKREHKIAQKIYWVVIDKTERFEKDVGSEDDEEAG